MRLFQAFNNSSFILSLLLWPCQIIVVRTQTTTQPGPTQTSIPFNTSVPFNTGVLFNFTFEHRWKSSPTSRGTAELLRSCFLTIVLAIWSSVILNTQMTHGDTLVQIEHLTYNPDAGIHKRTLWRYLSFEYYKELWESLIGKRPSVWARWKHKLFWAALNLVVPELAFGVAIDERTAASHLLRFLQEDTEVLECREIFHRWDLSMGFYAVTGGFYV